MPLEQGICIPNTCQSSDVNQITNELAVKATKLMLSINSLQYSVGLITFRSGYINSVERLEHQEAAVIEAVNKDVVEHFKCHEQKSEAFRFSHPTADPLWTAAMSVVLFFTAMSIIGTILDTYFVIADKHFEQTTGKHIHQGP